MSFLDSALNIASTVIREIPGLGSLSSLFDTLRGLWDSAQGGLGDLARSTAREATADLTPQQQEWVNNAIDAVFG